jgi:hypothetical protein
MYTVSAKLKNLVIVTITQIPITKKIKLKKLMDKAKSEISSEKFLIKIANQN